MTEQEQRIAIAEACGWMQVHASPLTPSRLVGRHDGRGGFDAIPDFPHDLNAMHEAEQTLSPEQWRWYDAWLCRAVLHDIPNDKMWLAVGNRPLISATPTQRAEAFLRTLGRWKE